jgi:hypothetical protein
MNASTLTPVAITGKLVIRTIHGRNGDFNVGLLETSIGSFSVKDRELEQYNAGTYDGQFVIGRIFMHSWSYGANSGSEIRVRLDAMSITGTETLTPDDERKLQPQISDPLDEETTDIPPPQPAEVPAKKTEPAPVTASAATRRPQFTAPTPAAQEAGDQALFGALWPLGNVVKLDATAPRQILRQQKVRLTQLGYDFCAEQQHFVKSAADATLH